MNVAIVGCGLIGEKRARNLGGHALVAVADPVAARAQKVAAIGGADCRIYQDWQSAILQAGVEIVVVATPNHLLAPVTTFALQQRRQVLVEKPAARSAAELATVRRLAGETGCRVKVGFSLRYHQAIRKAFQIFESGGLGEPMFIRARYGHGGRVGYDREWRADPAISGGGELLDQGIHLIDLSRWFFGDFTEVSGFAPTYFWDMPVDDNGFVLLKNPAGKAAWLHASCTEWKNLFCLEVYGRTGKLQVDGLGGSYGTERLSYYKMSPQMGPPETMIWEYPGEDPSWRDEFSDFVSCIQEKLPICGDVEDAWQALKIIDKIYGREDCR
jgi:predicted dehydrogenase